MIDYALDRAVEAIATVRVTCQKAFRELGGTLIRINTREPDLPVGHVSIPTGAPDALLALDIRVNTFKV